MKTHGDRADQGDHNDHINHGTPNVHSVHNDRSGHSGHSDNTNHSLGMQKTLNRWFSSNKAKPLLFLLALLPLAWLIAATALDLLGANPAEALVRATGDWTLRALCLVLAITPLRTALGLSSLARFRRMLGLFVYFYAALHLLCYSGFDMGFDLADILQDIQKRPFILVGFSAFVLLTPLALTSFNRAIKTLGAKRWQQLHRLVYGVAGLAVLHFFWIRSGKNNFAEVWLYACILGALLAWRVLRKWKTVQSQRTQARKAAGPAR